MKDAGCFDAKSVYWLTFKQMKSYFSKASIFFKYDNNDNENYLVLKN